MTTTTDFHARVSHSPGAEAGGLANDDDSAFRFLRRHYSAPGTARPAAPAANTPDMDRWLSELQDWCDADPNLPPPRKEGLWARMVGRLRPSAADLDDETAGAATFVERRREAVNRVLACHAMGEEGWQLDLRVLRLSSLPPGLDRLRHLKHLDISDNTGFHRLPETLALCRGLRTLTARNCFVTEVPQALAWLQHLELLDLSANFGLRELPDSLAQAPRLATVILTHCGLQSVPEAMARMPVLQLLDLSHNLQLHSVPAAVRDHPAVDLAGTPVALLSNLLQAPRWNPPQQARLAARLDGVVVGWQECLGVLRKNAGLRTEVNAWRSGLSLVLRTDGVGTEDAWSDAMQAVGTWLHAGQPITPERLLEIGWRLNGCPAGGPRARTREFQRLAAGTAGATVFGDPGVPTPSSFMPGSGEQRSYPMAASLPRHLETLAAWLSPATAVYPALTRLEAVERAARLYQALVSLRPLDEGNAPAALMAMDWALQQHGLPPVVLEESVLSQAVVFAEELPNEGPNALVTALVEGMEELVHTLCPGSLRLLA